MNKVILMGRLTRDPDVRYTQGEEQKAIARFTLAVDRRNRQEGQQNADFPSCVAFGQQATFCEKYLNQGKKVVIVGRLQTGSYTNREGVKVYTTDVIVEEIEFAESKGSEQQNGSGSSQGRPAQKAPKAQTDADGFMNIPDGIDEELPFN